MAKGFDISLKDRAASYDVNLDNTSFYDIYLDSSTKTYDIGLDISSSAYNIYLGQASKPTDIFIENIPLHLLVDLADDIAIVIDSGAIDMEAYGALSPSTNYICLDSAVVEVVHKYENIENNISLGFEVEDHSTKSIDVEEVGIEVGVDANFVVRRLRLLSEVDDYSLSNIDSMTLEDLTYIIINV